MQWLLDKGMPLWSYVLLFQNVSMAQAGHHGANWMSVTWSLAIEEQFYLLLPLLIYIVPPRKLKWVLIGLILSAPVLRTMLVLNGYGGFTAYLLMPARADALLLGTLAALAVRDSRARDLLARHVAALYLLASALLLAIVLGLRGPSRNPAVFSPALVTYGLSLLALFYVCVLLIAVTERRGPATFVVRNQALRDLGLVAYGVYIIHLPISGLLHGWFRGALPRIDNWNDAQITALALVATLLLARLSWRWLEAPILSLGQSHRYDHRPLPMVADVERAGAETPGV